MAGRTPLSLFPKFECLQGGWNPDSKIIFWKRMETFLLRYILLNMVGIINGYGCVLD